MNYLTPESLETDRLLLRMFQEDDWRDLHKYYSDDTCMKYTVGRALTEGETWRAMAAMIGHWTGCRLTVEGHSQLFHSPVVAETIVRTQPEERKTAGLLPDQRLVILRLGQLQVDG